MISITSDYYQSHGDPQPYLKRIAEAGFSHVHWCHEWNSDRIYTDQEILYIKRLFTEYGLRLLNLHGSHGQDRFWVSADENQRQGGIELAKNRIKMTAVLGGDVIIMHIPTVAPPETRPAWLTQIRQSLDDIELFARSHRVRVALENMIGDDFEMLETLLLEHDPDFLGLCFDSGHANMGGLGLAGLVQLKDRLIAIHLHDNDGMSDQHKLPYTGSIEWSNVIRAIASSSYQQCVNLEVHISESGILDESEFLRQAYLAGEKLSKMIAMESGPPPDNRL